MPRGGNGHTVVSPVHAESVKRGSARDKTADVRITRGDDTKLGIVVEPKSFETLAPLSMSPEVHD